jgi:uncharacterized membrane protein
MRIEHIYWLAAALLAAAGVLDLRDRRWTHALFWLVLALVFAFGDVVLAMAKDGQILPQQLVGGAVIALALLASFGMRRRVPSVHGATNREAIEQGLRRDSGRHIGHRLFVPALLIPLLTAALVLGAKYLVIGGIPLLPKDQVTLGALTVACLVAVIAALRVTGANPGHALVEHQRLLDTIGWAAVLPMLLAALGNVFTATGVGSAIAHLVEAVIPTDNRLACLAAYALGMAVFTAIMGNAFAAFPVMTAGIAMPLLVARHGANPAVLCSLGMLAGYCGTLLTPMAANFNLVPAALLELRDANGVIRMQVPTALILFVVNFGLMAFLVFR